MMIRGETGAGHFSSCRFSSREGKENWIHYVREKNSGYGYDAYWLGHSLASTLASLSCLRIASAFCTKRLLHEVRKHP